MEQFLIRMWETDVLGEIAETNDTRRRKIPLSGADSDACVNIRTYCIIQYLFNELVVTLLHI